ncbi:enterochelin esterase-like enzyme [Natronospira proteinivora]|uniref:Enterochelin esterase-like enzyme n=1 Tax=Natronospira proteinivora TaxID=1807133 RepID=A0ABT1G5J2_9GAMM|nr:enterochelin esterase-like enzyme [Natronospira proteinivora]
MASLLYMSAAAAPMAQPAHSVGAFDEFLALYEDAAPDERRSLAESFIADQQAAGGFPITPGNGEAIFFYLADSETESVHLRGDWLPRNTSTPYWSETGQAMVRTGNLFHARVQFEPDARLDYAFLIDGETRPDPNNPRRLFSGVGGGVVSELRLPAHERPDYLDTLSEPGDIPESRLISLEQDWVGPAISVYLPPGYDRANRYPVLYTADGSAWLDLINLPGILDALIKREAIQPVIAVMIDARTDRRHWYQYNPDYLDYLETVVHFIDREYATKADPEHRIHAGTSAGGRAALYAGLERPDLFGRLALLSPSLTGPIHYLAPFFSQQRLPDTNLKIWLSAGSYEGNIHKDAKILEAYFENSDIAIEAIYPHQGHSFGAWQEQSDQFLRYFLAE